MPLDVHVTNDPNDDRQLDRAAWFEDRVHEFVFREIHEFPRLSRAADFYADAQYHPAELPDLVAEIDRLLPRLSVHPPAVRAMESFRAACVTAIARGDWVCLLCD